MGGAAGPEFQRKTGEREMTQTPEGTAAARRPLGRRDPVAAGLGAAKGVMATGAARPDEHAGAVATAAGPLAVAPAGRAPARVLVVDDSRVFRAGMVRAVQACPDLELLAEADGGEAALEAISELHPDLVILDLRMPDLDGIGVLRELHARDDGPDCRVLVISASLEDGVQDEVMAAGADACLSKALSRADICATAIRLAAD